MLVGDTPGTGREYIYILVGSIYFFRDRASLMISPPKFQISLMAPAAAATVEQR
jgi:hypothetical protein